MEAQPARTTPKPKRRWFQFRLATLLLLFAVFGVLLSLCIVPIGRYAEWVRVMRQTRTMIENARPSSSAAVNPVAWDGAHGWVLNAYANICASPEHVSTEEMYLLREDVQEKLTTASDFETLLWIWNRLGETGPAGKHYVTKFRPQFRYFLPSPGP